MNKEGKKCAIYVRVSTEMQVDGFSLDAQRNTLKRYAEREGMIVKEIYEDAGKSGKSIEGRPSFKRLLDDIKDGLEIDYILVYKLSRFGRNAADILNSIELIQSYEINLIATEEGIDSSQTSGKLLISVLSAVSEIERENILEQTMNGRREKARQGGWNGGFAPYGYEMINGAFYIVEDEAQIVKEIYNMFVNELFSYSKIANLLNLQGKNRDLTEHRNRSLSNWSKDAIKNIIKNPLYKGTIAFGRRKKVKIKGTRNEYARVETADYISGEGKHEAIISEELWNQAQLRMKERSKKSTNPAYSRKYLLSGLLRCPMCGGKMSSATNRWTTNDGKSFVSAYYRCKNAWNETGHPCTNKSRFDMVKVDEAIVTFVKNSINKGLFAEKVKDVFAENLDTSNLEKQKSSYKSKLSQVLAGKEQLEKIIDYMPLDTPHRDKKLSDYNKRLDDLYNDIDEIESNIKDLDKKIEGIRNGSKNYDFIMANLEAFETLFDKMDDGEKRKMITMLISEISVDPTSNIINRIKFHFNIESDDENIEFELPIENGPEAIAFREVLNGSKPSKQFMPHYLDEEGHEIVLREVDGKEVLCRKYQKSYHIPKERAHHYNRKQATYQQIKDYIMEKYGLKVHTVYISQVKRMYGVEMQANRRKTDPKYKCPQDKVAAIEDALKYFNIIKESQA